MDVWRITVAALRRWYILLPLLALTGFAAITVGEGVRPQYEVEATAILVPGIVRSEIANPYGSMDGTNQALAIVLGSNESRARIAEQGLDPEYSVTPRSRSTFMNFSVVSETPEMGIGTGMAVFELALEELQGRQGAVGIPPDAQIGLEILEAPSVGDVVTEGRLRNMAVVGLLGASLSLLTAVLFDDIVGLVKRWIRRRRDRHAKRTAASAKTAEAANESPPAESPGSDQPAAAEETPPAPTDVGTAQERRHGPTRERRRDRIDLARARSDG